MRPGTVIAGRYQILRPLAKGGMATIFEARDNDTKQTVALKILRDGLNNDKEVLARFEREARAASSLKSPHVVRVFDFGTTGEERPFMVMELLAGNDLAKELVRRGAIGLEEAASYMAQTCHAMVEAHEAGIVHRDLKPTNLFLVRDGARRAMKVLDFGIAKLLTTDEQITRTQALFGSPHYMAPETFRGAKLADARSDIWSLGVIFYEMLTGTQPFQAENAVGVGLTVSREEHVAPSLRRPVLPRSVDVVIGRALKKDPAQRYQTMREFLAAFEVFLPRGRNDTMTIAAVTDPRLKRDERPGAVLQPPPRAPLITDLGMIEPTHPDADPTEAPTRVAPPEAVAAAVAMTRPEDDALDMPTRVRTTDDPATLVQPIPSFMMQPPAEPIVEELSIDPDPTETTGPDLSHARLSQQGETGRIAGPVSLSTPPPPPVPLPARKSLPTVAWLLPLVAVVFGAGGWCLARAPQPSPNASAHAASLPDALETATNAASSATGATAEATATATTTSSFSSVESSVAVAASSLAPSASEAESPVASASAAPEERTGAEEATSSAPASAAPRSAKAKTPIPRTKPSKPSSSAKGKAFKPTHI